MNAIAAASGGTDTVPPMSDATFERFRALTLDLTGIELDDTRKSMLTARLMRRVRALSLDGFDAYLDVVRRPDEPERLLYINAVTTNLTYFFREPHHFEWMRDTLCPALIERASGRPVRIWSAGCSAGQEPYSLAITAHEAGLAARREVRILATDIHSALIPQITAGRYNESELRGLSDERRNRWIANADGGGFIVDDALRKLVIARRLNLFGAWPVRTGVDLIVCRNVMIYFDEVHRQRILEGFASLQRPGDHLLIGHSETIRGGESLYERVDNTVYLRR